jgi:hypothetical protein
MWISYLCLVEVNEFYTNLRYGSEDVTSTYIRT